MKHWLRKYFYRRPRAIPRWWRMPEQFLLRYEVRWSIRWLTRWPGIVWLLFPIVFISTAKLCRIMSTTAGLVGEVAMRLSANRLWVFFFVMFLLWLWLLQHRTFVMFSRHRLEDLVLTCFSGRHFWPAFLVAPVLIPGFVVFQFIAGLVAVDIAANASKAFSLEYLNRITAPDVVLYNVLLNHAFAAMILLALTWVLLLCIYALTARMAVKCQKEPSIPTLTMSFIGAMLRVVIYGSLGGCFAIVAAIIENFFLPITLYFFIVVVALMKSISRNVAHLRALDTLEILRGRIETGQDRS
ncbi:MAG: hypothetical protein ABFD69_16235 [Candidatus Sumerlaeia bacterium]